MRTLPVIFAAFLLAGCTTIESAAPAVAGNFLEKGTVYPKFQGNTFYMATGQVDLYRYGFWGDLQRTGKKVDVAVAIQADPATGKVERIAALQPRDSYSARYVVEDMKGGILLTDFQPYPHWLDAVSQMETADNKLSPAPNYEVYARSNGTVVYVEAPAVRWIWWHRPLYYHHHYYRRIY